MIYLSEGEIASVFSPNEHGIISLHGNAGKQGEVDYLCWAGGFALMLALLPASLARRTSERSRGP